MNKKFFKITINGKSYEVEVEEITSLSSGVESRPQVQAQPPSMPTFTPTPAPKPTPEPVPAVTSSPVSGAIVSAPKREVKDLAQAGGVVVSAPMPGKILRVLVKEGDSVSKGDLLLVLEAMKMENEIFAPVSGVVRKVAVSGGDSVNTGDTLVVIG